MEENMTKKRQEWQKREIEKCEWIASKVLENSEVAKGIKAYYKSLVK
jgi:hypothetical protein